MVSSNTNKDCAVTIDGEVICWGQDLNPSVLYDSIPEGPFAHVEVGYRHACALRENGALSCWGSQSYASSQPANGITFLSGRVAPYQTCGLKADGLVKCWGPSTFGIQEKRLTILF